MSVTPTPHSWRRGCSPSQLALVWLWCCRGAWQGMWLGSLPWEGLWVPGEAELSLPRAALRGVQLPFPGGREGGSSCQPSLAGSPRGGFWLLPSRNKDRFLPLRPGSGASVLPHDLGSRELWPALAAAVPSPGDLFLAVYFRALFLCSVRRCCVASADRDQITVPWGNHLLDFQRSPGTFPLWVRSSGKARALLRVGSGPLSGSV